MEKKEDINRPQTPEIHQTEGVTPSERYLKKLCERSFLSLWSFAGIYRDQGKRGANSDGKEVCDLLVVFDNHIIIFSDKDCVFPNTGDLELDWSRWYRKAVQKSADQIWGAERWIQSHPSRLFLDRACTIPFPIHFPNPATAKIHRIVVAHGATDRCKEEIGGSGSLMIIPNIIGDSHTSIAKGGKPFAIGQVDPSKGYVHVFDDTTLDVVIQTLDTITDFTEYLVKKEQLIISGRLGGVAGEEDLLAYYLGKVNEDRKHDFIFSPKEELIFLNQGFWSRFCESQQRLAQLEANQVSYFWDSLIEQFTHHIINGSSVYTFPQGIRSQEISLRLLARESRLRRRILSEGFLDLIKRTPNQIRSSRLIVPQTPVDPYYIFLLLPEDTKLPHEKYRQIRRELLECHLYVAKIQFPQANHIIGIATESGRKKIGSEDLCYLDASIWSKDDQIKAEKVKVELECQGLLSKRSRWDFTVDEYPNEPMAVPPPWNLTAIVNKGRHRNSLCPCGSGKKVKNCCGRSG